MFRFIFLALLLTSCAITQNTNSLQIKTLSSRNISLDINPLVAPQVFINVSNNSGNSELDLAEKMQEILKNKGYQLAKKRYDANLIIDLDILYAGLMLKSQLDSNLSNSKNVGGLISKSIEEFLPASALSGKGNMKLEKNLQASAYALVLGIKVIDQPNSLVGENEMKIISYTDYIAEIGFNRVIDSLLESSMDSFSTLL